LSRIETNAEVQCSAHSEEKVRNANGGRKVKLVSFRKWMKEGDSYRVRINRARQGSQKT